MSRIDDNPEPAPPDATPAQIASAAGPVPPAPVERRRTRRDPSAPRPERRLIGIPVSAGIAIGPVFGAAEAPAVVVRHKIQAADTQAETNRFETAVAQSRKQLMKLKARLGNLPEDSQAEIAPLLDAYLHMIGPSRLIRGVRKRISDMLVSAETAVQDETDAITSVIMAMPAEGDPAGRRRRAEEVREVGRRLVRNLTHTPFRSFTGLPAGAVLACELLRPADAALLDPTKLAGCVTDEGGSDGHTAIMLRALGVPAVLGVAGLGQAVRPGDMVVVDGVAGSVVVNPTVETLAAARKSLTAFTRVQTKLASLRRLPAETTDNEAIDLQANLEIPVELPLIAKSGAMGIGLLRSEFLFMNRETLPNEDEQTEAYRSTIEAMGGHTVTIRVLDWGGEKDIEALQSEGIVPEVTDDNPALGLRGIRLLLRETDLFETQLAAILRASIAGPTRVLLPMVTNLAEVRQARDIYERVARRLRRKGERLPEKLPPLGIMIETPGAALSADALALEADFFAIGTNDLTMYTLAVDRGETDVAALYDPLHPAVLRLVQFATEAALRMRMPVSVCGEMAGNPRMIPLLMGLGLRSFSMNAAAVPRVKQAVRAVAIDDCVRLARKVMEQSDPARIHELVLGTPHS
ncbi:MAG: phosphoenolpyruvate--protein phosphotransferase [Acetobacteraceae bacterium]|nr:phosphoenolpyruvate--protein phosphotransferase [Acetobacteraceae bacterium]